MKKQSEYFEGYYFRQEGQNGSAAFIPSLHVEHNGNRTGCIQVITQERTWVFTFPGDECRISRKPLRIQIGDSRFSTEGCSIRICRDGADIRARFLYGPLRPLHYDIMGPFQKMPFMQCRHSVLSMRHLTDGKLVINGKEIIFERAAGYLEGDRGHSFPERYVWTQGALPFGGSIMLAVATIPVVGESVRFRGCIGVISYRNQEYRLATYKGCRIRVVSDRYLVISQGKYMLQIRLLEPQQEPDGRKQLFAPKRGSMDRLIKEHVSCRVHYRFVERGKEIFSHISSSAAFEAEWDRKS